MGEALITGASSGIGRAMAQQLAAGGTRVVLAARREAELAALADEIARAGGRADVCVLDVSDTAAIKAAVERWEKETGGLDLVIANAGVGLTKPAHKLTWDEMAPTVEVCAIGAMATLMAAMPPMLARGRGTLVGVSSLAAGRGLPTSGAYSAAKAALSTFLETLRLDLSPKGIKVVDVRPGFVDTPMTRQNRFWMPFMMSVDEAARAALRGIGKGRAVVAFPFPMRLVMSAAEIMPDGLYRWLAGIGSPARKKKKKKAQASSSSDAKA